MSSGSGHVVVSIGVAKQKMSKHVLSFILFWLVCSRFSEHVTGSKKFKVRESLKDLVLQPVPSRGGAVEGLAGAVSCSFQPAKPIIFPTSYFQQHLQVCTDPRGLVMVSDLHLVYF